MSKSEIALRNKIKAEQNITVKVGTRFFIDAHFKGDPDATKDNAYFGLGQGLQRGSAEGGAEITFATQFQTQEFGDAHRNYGTTAAGIPKGTDANGVWITLVGRAKKDIRDDSVAIGREPAREGIRRKFMFHIANIRGISEKTKAPPP